MKTLFEKDTWQEIFGSIQKNRTRTIITMIGVLWGIFIYITLAGASKGLDNGFEKAFSSISSNSLFIWAQQTSLPYGGYKARRQIRLTTNDVDIIKRRVAVIGERTLLELFEEDENPVGKYININSVSFKVIGVHKFRQGGGFGDDGDIYIPFATYKDLFNTGKYVGFFMMSAFQDADIVEVEKEVKYVLKDIHKIDPEDDQALGGFNLGEIFKKTLKFADGLTFLSLVVGIATILAGVIGIGNILLISVKERTKEIGIRRALGARPSQVRTQIIIESAFLTILAGIIGIILGTLILFAINMATQDLSDFPYTNPTVPLEYIFGALSMMIILGTLIGLIPAQIAVKARPIEALREE